MRLTSSTQESNLPGRRPSTPQAFGASATILDRSRRQLEWAIDSAKPIVTEYRISSGGKVLVILPVRSDPLNASLRHSGHIDLTLTNLGTTGDLMAERAIKKLRELESNWDGNGSAPPSAQALSVAKKVLRRAFELTLIPDRVVADSESGVSLYYLSGEKMEGGSSSRYASLNVDADGATVAAEVDRKSGVNDAWDLTLAETRQTLLRLHSFVR